MAKNPFKKGNVVDTLINVGVGGAGNVAADYLINNVEMLKSLDADTINIGKFVVGSVGSAMVSNKYVKALMDGFAVVGASNYISSLMADQTTSGVPAGTIGRARYIAPRRAYARRFADKTSGVPTDTVSNIMQ